LCSRRGKSLLHVKEKRKGRKGKEEREGAQRGDEREKVVRKEGGRGRSKGGEGVR